MVLGIAAGAAAGLGGGLYGLWDYNRRNFLYDREMRQKQEFQVVGFRNLQAGLWREDVRDITGLTERKMDSYLVVNTLQLAMCVALFAEGRLDPGTPQFVLRFYMLTLGAAFMYLLMSVWLAMHASVVAQTSMVRILTQRVRLPVPTWKQLQDMRTHASAYEGVAWDQMLRVPFVGKTAQVVAAPGGAADPLAEASNKKQWALDAVAVAAAAECSGEAAAGAGTARARCGGAARTAGASCSSSAVPTAAGHSELPDPWAMDRHGQDIYDLQRRPISQLRHAALVKHAALSWQCYDAFARVSMSFGTNQLLYAITYYCLGYVSYQDGAPWPALCIGAIMVGIALTLVQLDLTLTKQEMLTTWCLVTSGPACASVATCMFTLHRTHCPSTAFYVLVPAAFVLHGVWLLFFALRGCGVKEQGQGLDGAAHAFLPTNFRTVMYVDVFRWIANTAHGSPVISEFDKSIFAHDHDMSAGPAGESIDDVCEPRDPPQDAFRHEPRVPMRAKFVDKLSQDLALLRSERAQCMMDDHERERVERLADQFCAEFGADFEDSVTGEVWNGESASSIASGVSEYEGDSFLKSECVPLPPARWLKLHGYSDFGAKVPYYYHTASGEVRAPPDGGPADPAVASTEVDEARGAGGSSELSSAIREDGHGFLPPAQHRDVLSITMSEEHLQSLLLDAAAHQRSTSKSSSSPTSSATGSLQLPQQAPPALQPMTRVGRSAKRRCSTFLPPLEEQCGNLRQQCQQPGQDNPPDPVPISLIDAGRFPWKALLSASVLLSILWFICAALSFGRMGGSLQFGTKPMMPGDLTRSQLEQDGNSLEGRCAASWLAVLMEETLLPGAEIRVDWPRESGFMPRSLASDPTGKHVVIADDFGVYHGEFWDDEEGHNEEVERRQAERRLAAPPAPRRRREAARRLLRGIDGDLDYAADDDDDEPSLMTSFMRAPPCVALEGQALKDIGVVCSQGKKSECRVLVLHTNGYRLTECPLLTPLPAPSARKVSLSKKYLESNSTAALSNATMAGAEVAHRSVLHAVESRSTWSIAGSWLNMEREQVESLAVDNECRKIVEPAKLEVDHEFLPEEPGCVVVGTTQGRVVQLRRHVTQEKQLVPEWTLRDRHGKVGQGSLHVFRGGVVMILRTAKGSVQALNSQEGNIIGEWRLPQAKEVEWLMISGGGDSIFVLGRKKETFVFWRFPVPDKLKLVMGAYAYARKFGLRGRQGDGGRDDAARGDIGVAQEM